METAHGSYIMGMCSCVTLNENTENKNLHITNKHWNFKMKMIGISSMHIQSSLPVKYEKRMEVKVRNSRVMRTDVNG